MKSAIRTFIVLSIAYVVIFPPQAHAYLDPGTGSYVIQVVGAILFGGIFVAKTGAGKIKEFFSNITKGKDKHSEKSSEKK
ncbi:MAG TPA: hypothetical protein VG917_03645 [Patescibacteria group bacterium]|nr:hypothetical protein [Patescibacteria group bacterium]